MMGWLRLAIRAPLVVLCILLTLLFMTIGSLFNARRLNRRIMCLSFKLGTLLFGLRIRIQGALASERPLLLVSNHFSYLDIFAIGSSIPAAFTPKSEIAGWPVIGSLCKRAGCVFIDRRASQTLQNKKQLDDARRNNDIISLFPEGTTNEGKTILPFKSAFFSIAEQATLPVQPLSVVYTHLNGKPLDDAALPIIGWYGDAEFFPHVVEFLQQKSADVTLIFHPAVTASQFTSRKELAQFCKEQVEKGFTRQEALPNNNNP